MMKRNTLTLLILCTLSALLLSLPWLLPHAGALSLVGFIPLLMADDMATCTGQKKFWIWHFYTFVLWNAVTTFWVCNATLGGGIFAILANAFRVASIFICAEYINPAFASKTWHDWSGLLFFCPASLLGLMLLHGLLAGEVPFLKRRRTIIRQSNTLKEGEV